MIKDMRKRPRFMTIHNEGRQTGRNSRIRSRRLEKFTGQDRVEKPSSPKKTLWNIWTV